MIRLVILTGGLACTCLLWSAGASPGLAVVGILALTPAQADALLGPADVLLLSVTRR